MREYKSGTAWCIWRWTKVRSEYITRLHLLKTPWFAVCLHWLHKPDPEIYMHDHPVSFLSIILSGWYTELRNGSYRRRNLFNFIRAEPTDRHRILYVAPSTVTLCFMGPKRREWGFWTPKGWIMWKDFYANNS